MFATIWLLLAIYIQHASSLASDEVAMGYQSALENANGSEIGDLSDEEICHPRLECFACLRHCYFHKAAGLSPFPSICLPNDQVYNFYEYFIYETVRKVEDCVNHTQRNPNATSLYRRNYTKEYRIWPQIEFPYEFHENKSYLNNTDYYGGVEWTNYAGLPLGETLIIVSGSFGVCVLVFVVLLKVFRRIRGRFVIEIQLNEAITERAVTISRIIPEESSSV